MELLKDLWASAVSTIRERTTNPLSISFVLSWIGWNYKFPLVLFSELSTPEKIEWIQLLYPDASILWRGALFYPLLTALIYVFGYSFLSERVVTFYRRRQIATANSVREVENERVLTVDETTNLVRRHEDEIRSRKEAEAQLRTQIEQLKNALFAAEAEVVSVLEKSTNSSEKVLSDLSKNLQSNLAKDLTSDLSVDNGATSDAGQVVMFKPGVAPVAGVKSLTQQQLRVLTILTEVEFAPQRELTSNLSRQYGIKPFFVDADIDTLEALHLLGTTNDEELFLTKTGRAVLAEFVKQGLWKI